MQKLQDKISPLLGEVTYETKKGFTFVVDGMQIEKDVVQNIEDQSNSEFDTIIFDQGKFKLRFKFISEEENKIRNQIAVKVRKAKEEARIKNFFEGFKCSVVNSGRKTFTTFEFVDKQKFADFLTKFKPVDTTLIEQQKRAYEVRYKLRFQNPAKYARTLRIVFQTQVGEVWITVPAQWVSGRHYYTELRKVNESEYHYFTGWGISRIRDHRVSKNVWHGNVFHWYGGYVDLIDDAYADHIVEEMITSLKNQKSLQDGYS